MIRRIVIYALAAIGLIVLGSYFFCGSGVKKQVEGWQVSCYSRGNLIYSARVGREYHIEVGDGGLRVSVQRPDAGFETVARVSGDCIALRDDAPRGDQ